MVAQPTRRDDHQWMLSHATPRILIASNSLAALPKFTPPITVITTPLVGTTTSWPEPSSAARCTAVPSLQNTRLSSVSSARPQYLWSSAPLGMSTSTRSGPDRASSPVAGLRMKVVAGTTAPAATSSSAAQAIANAVGAMAVPDVVPPTQPTTPDGRPFPTPNRLSPHCALGPPRVSYNTPPTPHAVDKNCLPSPVARWIAAADARRRRRIAQATLAAPTSALQAARPPRCVRTGDARPSRVRATRTHGAAALRAPQRRRRDGCA
mmetsp:Transcript_12341/g.43231  ORF Transcript_12341/g.43231 Transcript_12341/m.43231 type:complete len:265 (-) Transcript_12341:33-827(-)